MAEFERFVQSAERVHLDHVVAANVDAAEHGDDDGHTDQCATARRARTALRPPKAKEFESAYSTWAARGWLGTTSRSHSGSGSLKLAVGGRMPSRRATMAARHSRAAAAPNAWPCMLLVELTGRFLTREPKTAWMAADSEISRSEERRVGE